MIVPKSPLVIALDLRRQPIGGRQENKPKSLSNSFFLLSNYNIFVSSSTRYSLLSALSKNIAVSNGSACNSSNENPSHVLSAMGVSQDLAFSSLRISLGRYTTESEVDRAIEIIREEVAKQRANNILWERRVV